MKTVSSTDSLHSSAGVSVPAPEEVYNVKEEPCLSITDIPDDEISSNCSSFREEEMSEDTRTKEVIDEKVNTQQAPKRITAQNIIQTVTYFVVFIFFGFSNSLIGPTLGNLAQSSHTNIENMGWVFTCKGLGGILGSMIGGKGYDYFASKSSKAAHMFLSGAIFTMAFCLFLMPVMPNLWSLLIVYVLFGVSVGMTNMGVNILCMWTWKDKVTPVILSLSCSAGVGSFLAPLFLSTSIKFNIAYWITAAVVFMSGLVLVAGQFINTLVFGGNSFESTSNSKNVQADDQFKTVLPGLSRHNSLGTNVQLLLKKTKEIRIALVIGLALFGCVGLESSFGGLGFTYIQSKKLASSDKENSLMSSAFWIALTVSRLVAALVSSFVRPAFLLTGNVIMCFASIVIFLILPKSIVWIWIAIILMGVGISSQFPTAMSYPTTSMNVQVTGRMSSIMIVIASAAEMTIPVLITQCFGWFGVDSLFWILLMVSIVSAISYLILFSWNFILDRRSSSDSVIEMPEITEQDLHAVEEEVKNEAVV